jgi:hypothetical protein
LVVHIIVRHPSSSSRIVSCRAPVITGDSQRQSVSVIDQLRQVRAPASAVALVHHHPSSSLIRTAAAIPRISAAVPSPGIQTTHRSMAIIMGRMRRAVAGAPSRRLLVADGWCLAASCSRP